MNIISIVIVVFIDLLLLYFTMAEVKASIVPLNQTNYPTWKVQCRIALMKEGLWSIVDGTETAPPEKRH